MRFQRRLQELPDSPWTYRARQTTRYQRTDIVRSRTVRGIGDTRYVGEPRDVSCDISSGGDGRRACLQFAAHCAVSARAACTATRARVRVRAECTRAFRAPRWKRGRNAERRGSIERASRRGPYNTRRCYSAGQSPPINKSSAGRGAGAGAGAGARSMYLARYAG
jgi:hypothetical protein